MTDVCGVLRTCGSDAQEKDTGVLRSSQPVGSKPSSFDEEGKRSYISTCELEQEPSQIIGGAHGQRCAPE